MSLKTVLVEIEETAVDAIKSLGGVVKSFIITEVQKLVGQVKTTPLGTTAMNIVSALTTHAGSGEEKMNMLIAAVTPALTKLEAAGGLPGLAVSVEDFAKEFGQSVYNDFKNVAAPIVQKVADDLHPTA